MHANKAVTQVQKNGFSNCSNPRGYPLLGDQALIGIWL
jgi:hypothetical protein